MISQLSSASDHVFFTQPQTWLGLALEFEALGYRAARAFHIRSMFRLRPYHVRKERPALNVLLLRVPSASNCNTAWRVAAVKNVPSPVYPHANFCEVTLDDGSNRDPLKGVSREKQRSTTTFQTTWDISLGT